MGLKFLVFLKIEGSLNFLFFIEKWLGIIIGIVGLKMLLVVFVMDLVFWVFELGCLVCLYNFLMRELSLLRIWLMLSCFFSLFKLIWMFFFLVLMFFLGIFLFIILGLSGIIFEVFDVFVIICGGVVKLVNI